MVDHAPAGDTGKGSRRGLQVDLAVHVFQLQALPCRRICIWLAAAIITMLH